MTMTVRQYTTLTSPAPSNRDGAETRVSMESSLNELNCKFDKLWCTLAPYLSADMAEFILSAPESDLRLHGKKQEMTVLFADIRGFTALAEQVEPEACVEVLNNYYRLAVEAVLECGG